MPMSSILSGHFVFQLLLPPWLLIPCVYTVCISLPNDCWQWKSQRACTGLTSLGPGLVAHGLSVSLVVTLRFLASLFLSGREFKYLTLSCISYSEWVLFGFFTTSCKNHRAGRWSILREQVDHQCLWWCYVRYWLILDGIIFLIRGRGIRTPTHLTAAVCVFLNVYT